MNVYVRFKTCFIAAILPTLCMEMWWTIVAMRSLHGGMFDVVIDQNLLLRLVVKIWMFW